MNNVISFVKKHTILAIITGIVAGLLGWWVIATLTPHPLGEKMEYIGKKDYGNILGFDSYPYSVYYYKTNMSEDEVIGYFKASSKKEDDDVIGNGYTGTTISFTTQSDSFHVIYYDKGNTVTRELGLKDATHVISVTDENYRKATKYLK